MTPGSNNAPIASQLVKEDPDFADLVGEFVEGLSARVKILEHAARGNDFAQLRAAAHQLKGAAGGYGYPDLTNLAARLEQKAIQEAADDCASSLGEIKAMVSRLVIRD